MGGGIFRQLDAGDFEEGLSLLQEEAIGAAHVQQPPRGQYLRMNSTVRANSRRSTGSAPR